jgi:hypothetical protein
MRNDGDQSQDKFNGGAMDENLVDGGENFGNNRIRSISHQFPSKISFLRASQDKIQASKKHNVH